MADRVPDGGSPSASDDELFARLRGGASDAQREQAFRELFTRHHGRVFRWCERLLGDPVAAEDLVQLVFLDLWSRSIRYESRQRFGAWLYVLTRNRALNALRATRRERHSVDEELLGEISSTSDPLAELEREEFDAQVDAICRERLKPVEYQVIQLRYVWHMKVDEISQRLKLENASGARTHLRSAEAKLRTYLKQLHRRWGAER